MIYVIIGLGLLFFGLGFILTENNAKYLLSGYNTMSKEERKKFDLKGFIPFYKNFHIFLSISFIGLGLAFNAINVNAAGIFLAVYPIVAYIYFIWKSNQFQNGKSKSKNKLAIIVLAGTLVFVLGILGMGFKEDTLTVKNDSLEISGTYGEKINFTDIESISITENLPKISMRTNGFSLGEIKKGYFKSTEGKIKLVLNSDKTPYLKITKKEGFPIFFSGKNDSAEAILNKIQTSHPSLGLILKD